MAFREIVQGTRIFKREDVFDVEHVPTKLLFRDEEIAEIETYLTSITENERPPNILLTGWSGVGKSAIIKTVKEDIIDYCNEENIKNIDIIYIDCATHSTEFQVLREIYNTISISDKIPSKGVGSETVYSRLTEIVEKRKKIVIVILDEIDKYISNPRNTDRWRLLRYFHRRPDLNKKPRFSVIYITNKPSCFDNMNTDLHSSMNTISKNIKKYNCKQLRDILYYRLQEALTDEAIEVGIVPLGVLEYISAQFKDEHNDVRKALSLLYLSLKKMIIDQKQKLTEEIIDETKEKLYTESLKNIIKSLDPIHMYTVLLTLASNNGKKRWVETKEVHNRYIRKCEQLGEKSPVTKRMVLNYLKELEMNDILDSAMLYKGRAGGKARKWILVDEELVIPIAKQKLMEEYEVVFKDIIPIPRTTIEGYIH